MKPLKSCLYEGLLDVEGTINSKEGLVHKFLKDNYEIDGKYTIDTSKTPYIVDVDGNINVKNRKLKELTNNLFEFGEIDGTFSCAFCDQLKTLKGGPKKVVYTFSCLDCPKLISIKDSPKECGLYICANCKSLKSLEGVSNCNFLNCKYCGKDFTREYAFKCVNNPSCILDL